MKKQAGFTLIELVVVIVILGILAATALPKFIDLSSDAEKSAIAGVAGGLGSAVAVNYAGCSVSNNQVGPKCVKVTKCSEAGNLLLPSLVLGTAPSFNAYYLTADTAAAVGASVTCTINKDKTAANDKVYTASFGFVGAGN